MLYVGGQSTLPKGIKHIMGSIYKITNTVNGKAYIGQTRQDAEKTRIRDHLAGNSKGSLLVKQAIAKYGRDAFTYEILHDSIIPEFLDELEIEAIAKYSTIAPHGYNLTTGGGSGSRSEQTLRKMSEAAKGNTHWLGRKHTEESCQKISESKKGHIPWNKGKKGLQTAWNKGKKVSNPHWLGRKHTDEARQKMSDATKGQTAWNKGKKGVYTDETRQKISQSKETPECRDARTIFLSLPRQMDLAEKRKHLRQRFPKKSTALIWKWCKKFNSEAYSTEDVP